MNEDTLHLLSECAAGTDMAIRSLEDVLKNSAEGPLQKRLLDSKRQHEQLAAQAEDRLRRQGKEPKRADPAARAMSYLKTQAMLSMKPGDATTADLISTGCSMGIKSLARYCNQYPTADEDAQGNWKYSLRALPGEDVSDIARSFGGGGHALASGCTIAGPYADSSRAMMNAMEKKLLK